jgi:hypothetical protein
VANAGVGTAPVQGRWRVAIHDEVARWRCDSTPTSNRAPPRAGKGKLGVGEGWLRLGKIPRSLNVGRGTTRARFDSGCAEEDR